MIITISPIIILGVRDQFRLGGLRSVARIFYPLFAKKSSSFARKLHVLLEMAIWKIIRGAAIPGQPPASYAYNNNNNNHPYHLYREKWDWL